MEKQIGMRVMAVRDADDAAVRVFGFGVYEGEHVPGEEAVIGPAAALRAAGRPNPRIRLDSGETVYGCECWWGPEAAMREKMGGRREVAVSITAARREAQDAAAEQRRAVDEALREATDMVVDAARSSGVFTAPGPGVETAIRATLLTGAAAALGLVRRGADIDVMIQALGEARDEVAAEEAAAAAARATAAAGAGGEG